MKSVAWQGEQRVTQFFNDPCCRASYAVFGMQGHNGIDLATNVGVELYAPERAYVLERSSDPHGYGLTVYLLAVSGNGWRFGHMSQIAVSQGETIPAGTLLGLSGNTGNSTGPHLHLGLRPPNYDRNNGFGGYIDPITTLNALTHQEDDPVKIAELEAKVAALEVQVGEVSFDRDRYIEALTMCNAMKAGIEHLARSAYLKPKSRYRRVTEADILAAIGG